MISYLIYELFYRHIVGHPVAPVDVVGVGDVDDPGHDLVLIVCHNREHGHSQCQTKGKEIQSFNTNDLFCSTVAPIIRRKSTTANMMKKL